MALDVKGKRVEVTETGFLADLQDWSEDVARTIAANEGLELSDKHWDIIRYLRDQFYNHNENQPNTRNLVKAMQEKWGGSISAKDLYQLFPKDPSKQGGRIAGLPESRRKGGY